MDTQKPEAKPQDALSKARLLMVQWERDGLATIDIARALLEAQMEERERIIAWHSDEREKMEKTAVGYDRDGNMKMAMTALARATAHRLDAEAIRKLPVPSA